MTDEKYIRKAVELAYGWDLSDLNDEFWSGRRQMMLDALAAQLVRQVDALGSPRVAVFTDGGAMVDGSGAYAKCRGLDRTMNTIMAIVDSGVLSG